MPDDMQGSNPALRYVSTRLALDLLEAREKMVGVRRGAIDEACQAYCSEAFADGAVCAVYPDGAGVTICISSRIYAPAKAWCVHAACIQRSHCRL